MPLIRGTRTPAGAPAAGGMRSAGRAGRPLWPGITAAFDARCWACTWAMRDGVYQVKYTGAACDVREHRRAGSG